VTAYGVFIASGDNPATLAMYMPMGFGMAMVTYASLMIKDKETKSKYTILSQGMPTRLYWLGSLLAHYICLLPSTLVCIYALSRAPLKITNELYVIMLVESTVYAAPLLLGAYVISTFFETSEMAMKTIPIMVVLLSLVGMGGMAALFTLVEEKLYAYVAHAFLSVIMPLYPLPGILLVALLVPSSGSPFFSIAAWPLYGSVVSLGFWTAFLVYRDRRSSEALAGAKQDFPDTMKDEDVLAEEARVETMVNGTSDESIALIHGLQHTYKTQYQETPAVRGISYSVNPGECFGLLGPNGAGKTTTFSIMTGLLRPHSAGKVKILGHDTLLRGELEKASGSLGVCPQEDPVFPTISGRSQLLFYGSIKGVPADRLEQDVDALLHRLGFEPADAAKAAGTYSGGMKRKLSLAIALIGRPALLFLDEPSAAVDAAAKRHLWKVIKLRMQEQTVILTTHSMEEAEALCDRIAIQVKGQLRCLGSPQHIKQKYGSGYTVEVYMDSRLTRAERTEAQHGLVTFLTQKISHEVALVEEHASRYLFKLPPLGPGHAVTLGKVFTAIQENQVRLHIADYSIAQPSLEQVFVRFAREQEDNDHDKEMQTAISTHVSSGSSSASSEQEEDDHDE